MRGTTQIEETCLPLKKDNGLSVHNYLKDEHAAVAR